MFLQGRAGLSWWRELRSGRRSSHADLCDGLRVQGLAAVMVVVVVVSISEACVLARGGGAADRGALHLLQGFMTADVSQTAMASATPSLWAVCGHVIASPQHVPGTEVA